MSDASRIYGYALSRHLVDAIDYTAPAALYAGLFLSDPGYTSLGGVEVSGGSYERQLLTDNMLYVTLGTSPPVSRSNNVVIDFGVATADWGDVGWIALIGHLTDSTPYFGRTALDDSADITSGQQALFPIQALDMNWA